MSQIKFNARHGLSVGNALSISDDLGNFALTSLSVSGASTLAATSATSLSVSGATTFTLSPTAATPSVNDNSTKLATTAFVVGQAGTAGPVMDGTQTVGTSLLYSRQDHVHASDTSRAPTASPTLTGAVTLTGGSVAVSTPFLNVTQTWNGSGISFSGLKVTITDTLSANSSLMLDMQSGSNKFGVNANGSMVQVLATPNIARDIVGATGSRHIREYQDLKDDGVQGLPGSQINGLDSFEWGFTWNAGWDEGTTTYIKDRNNAGDHALMYRIDKKFKNQWWFSDGTTPGAISWINRIDFDLPNNIYTFNGTLITTDLIVTGTVGSLNLQSGSTISINSASVLSATTLGSGVVNSSLTSVGTIATGVWNGTAVPLANGGTGANTQVGAATAILPAASTSGHVLLTGGAGTFYWGPQTGAAGNVGTLLNTTRYVETATAGQTVFPTNLYVLGAKQLRVYINGVRQYDSEYTESTTTSFTLASPGAALGDVVMSEVDGYVNYQFTATATAFTPITGITATEVQSAIATLQNNKAALSDVTYIGTTSVALNRPSGALALTGVTVGGVTLAAQATGFTVAGGTTSKTLTVSNTLTLSGTDTATLNIGAGGTLGTGAYATIANYALLNGNAGQPFSASTFTGNLTGNVTGNASGSSGSCTGNAATATNATNATNATSTLQVNITNNNPVPNRYVVLSAGNTGYNALETNSAALYMYNGAFYMPQSYSNGLTIYNGGPNGLSGLNIAGNTVVTYQTISTAGTYQLENSANYVVITATTGTVTLTLSYVGQTYSALGRKLKIKTFGAIVNSASTNIAGFTSTTLQSSICAGVAGNWSELLCSYGTGNQWYIISRNP